MTPANEFPGNIIFYALFFGFMSLFTWASRRRQDRVARSPGSSSAPRLWCNDQAGGESERCDPPKPEAPMDDTRRGMDQESVATMTSRQIPTGHRLPFASV